MRATRLAVVTILAMVAVACGADEGGSGDTTTEPPATSAATPTTAENSPDTSAPSDTEGADSDELAVCPLLEPDEVATVLDSPDQGEESALLAPLYSCTWTDSSSRELKLSVARAPDQASAEALYEGGAELEGSEDLTGVGDAARLHPDYFIDGAEIEALSGPHYIDLAITEIDDDRALISLMEAVLSRLP